MIRRLFWSFLGWRCYAAVFKLREATTRIEIWQVGDSAMAGDLAECAENELQLEGWTRIGCWR